ncbi:MULTISPECIES: 23S rRNA (cytidine(2498)-2'-O)-methyltransferase RlmM [Idiomarinaceae]|uniref:Ribosomal RNA large subunit methyltransferase M n=3 Tax=Pseudidiomarina TaxID=2800384 RepID=A0A368V2F4_9GAMM|nr:MULTISPECIES: 23S rRNA (cytidine(2498)-2'-O)-methyltransferase RlmM [Idiomarinaceae]MDT7524773.1 23S rRNA (cytidine(2498)-2'-O)-methyltransferase RlmM [Pseudidiomarina sp. GXY010]MRJ41465.1 23S rRNA (cytidine(2498)-2'-O)-methyltransferase RlmM [Idiomarina sp. FeN1]NCU56940.1 23S rRNA (cytidine(2498)-2'-O)-methyltransferase RlmM [Idiomarina sp. FenA--70]NCU59649.1 23S rRNA (cytidine(2498)-2'-O)-methyltransferase RlmM [Idiomarina sp. FenBw--71]PWW14350.1 23S rRNA (cytidine2498-2'-O)-methyltra
MTGIVAYCRPGFENDCAAELQDKTAMLGIYGYCQTQPQQGYVLYVCQPEEADHLAKKLNLKELMFTRQFFVVLVQLNELPLQDRVGAIQVALLDDELSEKFPGVKPAGDIRVETPDTNDGKELSKFCRKFTVPLRQGLRKIDWLTVKESDRRPTLHAFFLSNQQVLIGYSYSFNQSPWLMGIPRLRSPSDAPSRSTLKLDEAFQVFVPEHEREERISSGMNAVDLGASPGGWTYQLVRRGMMVQAVDNGPMAPSLLETGQVKHIQEDGFKYRPKKKNVTWLVCDMVEKPARVGELMTSWLIDGDCKETIFNLKLPMKKRYAAVAEYLTQIKQALVEQGSGKFELQAKQLYHDREEVTVHIRWL